MRALESVLGQRFDRLQLVIALMPSADRTRAIAERAAERNIRIELVDVDDVHAAAAFDAGLAVARGDYVLFMHADDWFGPRALETLLKVAEEGDLDFALPLWVGDALGMPAALAEDTDARLYRTASEVSSAAATWVEAGAFDAVTGRLLSRSRIEDLALRMNLKPDPSAYMAAYLEGCERAAWVPAARFHASGGAEAVRAEQAGIEACGRERALLLDLMHRWGAGDEAMLAVNRHHLHQVIACINEVCARRAISSIERCARVRDILKARDTREAVAALNADGEARRAMGLMYGPIVRQNALACCLSARVAAWMGAPQELFARRRAAIA